MTDTTDTPVQPVLLATDLVAGYIPEVNILNGCNLVVNPGDFVGIIGPNGAGKSTMLKAILGLCTVRSGTIMLRDTDITGKIQFGWGSALEKLPAALA